MNRHAKIVKVTMQITLVLLLLIKVAISELNSNNDTNKELIFNGKIYNRDEYPFVVFYDIQNGKFSCTGSLIRTLYVLTAAHCTYGEDKTKIQVGTIIYIRSIIK